MQKSVAAFVLSALVFGTLAAAQSKVDQGKPGIQGPWPVAISTTSAADGGTSTGNAVKFFCNSTRQSTTAVNTTDAGYVPGDGGLAGRWMIRVCNTAKNSGTPIVACTDDGQHPIMSAASGLGETIEVGDCLTYYTNVAIRCVSDTAATYVTAEECN